MQNGKQSVTGFQQPPVTHNRKGNPRKAGFELEYAGVDLQGSVALMEDLLGCKARKENAFRYALPAGDSGEYRVEVDAALLHEGIYKQYLAAVGIDTNDLGLERKIDDLIEGLASVVVPCEIVTPPLPFDAMDIVEDIVVGLRQRKARGTGHSLLYAFGLHINAEAASLEADYLLNHVRAFSLLYDWICRASKVDLSRKLTSYIKPYPATYLKTILDPAYAPDIDTLIRDYLELVGSRNHALDMLPLFATLDEDTVKAQAKEPDLIKARPAFHYRLANSRIDQNEWTVAGEWNYWIQVETLAQDQTRLMQLCNEFLDNNHASLFKPGAFWATHIARELHLEDGE